MIQFNLDTAIEIRKDFNTVTDFVHSLVSDENGFISTEIKMPDNLTRYRIYAIAVKGTSLYGLGESLITAQLPLSIHPFLPLFINFGDKNR